MKNALSISVGLAGLAAALNAAPASATGVVAGTLIQNTASASYDSGASTTTVNSNTVTIRVDELLDVAVTSLDSGVQTLGAGTAVLTYQVTNTGNGAESFALTANPAVAGNGFDAVVQTIAVDTNNNGVYDPGVDAVIANGSNTSAIAPDTNLRIFVVVTLPAGAADNAASQVRLTAVSATGTGSPGTVIAGQGTGGGDAVVGATTAQDDALGSLRASLAAVTLTKSFVIADPFGGAKAVPGAVVTYSIRADVSGSGQVSNLHVTDIIPTGTTYEPGSLKLDGSTLTDVSDADAGIGSASGIDVNLATVAGGSSRIVSFQSKIN